MTTSQTNPKAQRLRSKRDIAAVFKQGRYHALGVLHAKTLATSHGDTRFLISVKKAIGHAPARNRIKRLVREAFRRHRHRLAAPHDICLFLTRRPSCPPTYAEIEAEIQKLITRLPPP